MAMGLPVIHQILKYISCIGLYSYGMLIRFRMCIYTNQKLQVVPAMIAWVTSGEYGGEHFGHLAIDNTGQSCLNLFAVGLHPPSFFSSSDGLVRNCVTFRMAFAQNSHILYWAVHQPITFSQLSDAIFFTCTRVHRALSNETQLFTQDRWISNTGGVHGGRERLCHPLLTQCLDRCLVSDSSTIMPFIYWGSLWGQICYPVIDDKLQLKRVPAA